MIVAFFESLTTELDNDVFALVNSGTFLRDALFESFFDVLDDDDVFFKFSDSVTNCLLADGRRKPVVVTDFLFLVSIGGSSNTDFKFFKADDNFLLRDFFRALAKDNLSFGELT